MNARKSLISIGIAGALIAPLSAIAADPWITTNDEAGLRAGGR